MTVRNVQIYSKMLPKKNTIDYLFLNKSTMSSESRSIISLLVYKIVNVLPETIRNRATKSYLNVNFSPKQQIAIRELETIAVAALHDNRTMSAKGSTAKLVRGEI